MFGGDSHELHNGKTRSELRVYDQKGLHIQRRHLPSSRRGMQRVYPQHTVSYRLVLRILPGSFHQVEKRQMQPRHSRQE